MFVDTHCHLSSDDYEDIEKVIKNAEKEKVNTLVISGYDKKNNEEVIEISKKHKNIYVSIGYHPSEADITKEEDLKLLEKQIKENERIVAIGEIGLDYHWQKDNKEKQKELFKKQLKLAEQLNLPVVIHTRDAFQDTFDILKESNATGVIHCFSGNIENAKAYMSLGFSLGIGGVLTFKNTNLKETIKEIPLSRIVLETDSPFLAPTPYRGKQNEPKYIPLIAKELSKIKNLKIEEIATQTTQNAFQIFNIK